MYLGVILPPFITSSESQRNLSQAQHAGDANQQGGDGCGLEAVHAQLQLRETCHAAYCGQMAFTQPACHGRLRRKHAGQLATAVGQPLQQG